VAPGDTAFGHRDADFAMVIVSAWGEPADDDANIQWVRDYSAAIAPYSEAGGYINFMDGDDVDRVRANYGQNYDRLLEVKRKFDPGNLFRINQNIAP
jgi:FAD/FMN-containing dehydrogenase